MLSFAVMVFVVGHVLGVAEIDNKVFVVFMSSSNIEVYDAVMMKRLSVITVEGLKDPNDIVVCRHDRQLYVADYYCCIWRVSVDDHSYVKWMTTQSSTDKFHVWTLSLTSRRLLVTSLYPPTLHQYSTVDSRLLHHISLPLYVRGLLHAVETTRQTFVVGHYGTSQDKYQNAVSELLPVTAVNAFRLSNNICAVGLTTYKSIDTHTNDILTLLSVVYRNHKSVSCFPCMLKCSIKCLVFILVLQVWL